MRLKNKKTGGLATLVENEDCLTLKTDAGFHHYFSLAGLNEEWQDYEEPEEDFWYIDSDCETYGVSRAFNQNDSDDVLFNKQIGNYFETKEEAEKAVEKLKAWKRLKDKGFRFRGWIREHKKGSADITIASFIDEDYDITNDLDLLFSGEDD